MNKYIVLLDYGVVEVEADGFGYSHDDTVFSRADEDFGPVEVARFTRHLVIGVLSDKEYCTILSYGR